jgi:phosphonate transport system substrate-binding protein
MPRIQLVSSRCLILAAVCCAASAAWANDPSELVFVFQKQKDPATIKSSADQVAAFLTAELGMPVKTVVPTDYGATVQAMVSRKADIAYVSSIPFLLARRDAGATILVAEQRADAAGELRTDYDSVFVARKDSSIASMQDIVANARSIRMCFTSTTSTSGYVMAYRRLVNEGLIRAGQKPGDVFRSAVFGGSYSLALEQVIDGRADLCAVSFYTVEGDTATNYLKPEQLEQLRIVARTPGVPTHLVCARGGLSEELRARVTAALLKLSSEHGELIADVYGAKSFVEVDENEHVATAIEAMKYLGLPVEDFAK